MVVIVYEETLEEELRRKYNIPYDVPTEEITSFVFQQIADEALKDFKLEGSCKKSE